MPKKTVYAFNGSKLICSHEIVLDANYQVQDREFIQMAKENMTEDGIDEGIISSARFEVRDK